MNKKGFTLIEIVITLVLIFILAAVSTPKFNLSPVKTSAAAKKIAEDLKFARNLTRAKQVTHGVIFSAGSYTLFENDNSADPAVNPVNGSDFSVQMADQFKDVTISYSANLTGGIIKFGLLGEPLDSSGNSLDTSAVTLSSGSYSSQISIEAGTGNISISN